MAGRRIGDETDGELARITPLPEGGGEGEQREHDQRRAEPPEAAGFLRQGEQLEIVAEGFVMPLHGFINEEGADRVDGSLRMLEAVGVERERGDRGG